jgi:ribosomal protein L7Ae-like RNA K-turn-binding protein
VRHFLFDVLLTQAGGLDDMVAKTIAMCQEQQIPVFCVLTRRTLGRLVGRTVRVSIVGIVSFDGANEVVQVFFFP